LFPFELFASRIWELKMCDEQQRSVYSAYETVAADANIV
jgi:hypothetical protein